MNKRTSKQRALSVLMACILVLLFSVGTFGWFASAVLGKYRKEIGGDSLTIGTGDFDLSYQMRDPYRVSSMEEIHQAIDNDYTYIQLTDPDPTNEPDAPQDTWVLSGDDEITLKRPLVIDLNGQTLIRNGRLSVLDILEGATLTILDSSPDQKGGFYNPVGSVFSIEGGKMLVMGGKIESGPRYWEYYTYEDDNGEAIHEDRVDTGKTIEVVDNAGTTYSYPVIEYPKETTTVGDTKYAYNGNIYFDQTVGNIPADTYCYYICSDGSTSGDTSAVDANSADFTYSYYIDSETKEYINAASENPTKGSYLQVSIYGYTSNIGGAGKDATEGNDDTHYAAVNMQAGGLVVNAAPQKNYAKLHTDSAGKEHADVLPRDMTTGSFISYFGVEGTACIYMTGGEMHVENAGIFTTVNPSLIPTDGDEAGKKAAQSRGCCILSPEGSTGTLQVDEGVYRSYNNRAINAEGGSITVTDGDAQPHEKYGLTEGDVYRPTFDMLSNFTNEMSGRSAVYVGAASAPAQQDEGDDPAPITYACTIDGATFRIRSETNTLITEGNYGYDGTNAFAVFVAGGNVKVDNTDFDVGGSYTTGLYIEGGAAVFTDTNMTMKGNNNLYGVYAVGGNVTIQPKLDSNGTPEAGKTVKTVNWSFTANDNPAQDTYEVSVSNGSGSTTTETRNGSGSVGVTAKSAAENTAATDIELKGVQWVFKGGYSRGISLENGNINSVDCTYSLNGERSAAIQMSGDDSQLYLGKSNGEKVSKDASLSLTGDHSSAIYAQGGSILSENIGYRLTGANSYGIYATAGHVNFHDGFINLTHPDECYGIIGIESTDKTLKVDIVKSAIVVGGKYVYGEGEGTGFRHFNEAGDTIEGAEDGATYTRAEKTDYDKHGSTEPQAGAKVVGASMGVFISQPNIDENASTYKLSYIALYETELYSIDVGVGVRSGYVFLGGGGRIQTKNSSAIAATGGSVYIGKINESIEEGETPKYVNKVEILGHEVKTIDVEAFDNLKGGDETKDQRPTAIVQTDISGNGEAYAIGSYMGRSSAGETIDGESVEGNTNGTVKNEKNEDTNESQLFYEFTSPSPEAKHRDACRHFNVYDGVYINDGNFFSEDKIDVDFTGLRNYKQVDGDYAKIYERSYAVHVANGDAVIRRGSIQNAVGGGVGVLGGDVQLGVNDEKDTLNIRTTGTEYSTTPYNPMTAFKYKNSDVTHDTWQQYSNFTGGSGVVVYNGNLTVYDAKVKAERGAAMVVKSDDANRATTIHGGTFDGATDVNTKSGPGALYGLKVFGKATVYIYGGTFTGSNGGALFCGTLGVDEELWYKAEVYVYEGSFTTDTTNDSQLDGLNIYEGVNLVLGAYSKTEFTKHFGTGSEAETKAKKAIYIHGANCAVSSNPMNGFDYDTQYGIKSTVSVYYGTYDTNKTWGDEEKPSVGAFNASKGDIDNNNLSVDIYNCKNANTNEQFVVSTIIDKTTGTYVDMTNKGAQYYNP